MIPSMPSLLSAARLAKIRMCENQLDSFSQRALSVFKWIEQLNEVDTHSVEALVSPIEDMIQENYSLRSDIITQVNQASSILSNAPSKGHGMFKTPRVIE